VNPLLREDLFRHGLPNFLHFNGRLHQTGRSHSSPHLLRLELADSRIIFFTPQDHLQGVASVYHDGLDF
jgi:hypothetical protein